MLDHFSRSELACPTTDELRLATGFGEALERLRVELDAPIYLTSACRPPLRYGQRTFKKNLYIQSPYSKQMICVRLAHRSRLRRWDKRPGTTII